MATNSDVNTCTNTYTRSIRAWHLSERTALFSMRPFLSIGLARRACFLEANNFFHSQPSVGQGRRKVQQRSSVWAPQQRTACLAVDSPLRSTSGGAWKASCLACHARSALPSRGCHPHSQTAALRCDRCASWHRPAVPAAHGLRAALCCQAASPLPLCLLCFPAQGLGACQRAPAPAPGQRRLHLDSQCQWERQARAAEIHAVAAAVLALPQRPF